jgi:hypothetical protein
MTIIEKTRRVESAGFYSGARYELRDPRYLIDIANLLKAGYRLIRLAWPAIRCRLPIGAGASS